MEKLEDEAMTFCRECLSWQPVLVADGYCDDAEPVIFNKGAGEKESLYYTDLNSVIKKVQTWLNSDQELRLDLTEYNVVASILLNGDMLSEARGLDSEPHTICCSLLTACSEANRVLQLSRESDHA